MNLVGPGPVDVHYRDSDAAVRWLEPTGRWVDVGTGAGFPGIVFAGRFPDVPLDLVDSRKKRCRFLEEVLAEAEAPPHLRVVRSRHEDLEPQAYDGLMARALHDPDGVLAVAERLVRPGGTAVLFLQEDGTVPAEADVFHVEHYVVDGKRRKAVGVRV